MWPGMDTFCDQSDDSIFYKYDLKVVYFDNYISQWINHM